MKKSKKIMAFSISGFFVVAAIVTVVIFMVIASSVINEMADVRVVKNEATLAEFNLIGEEITVMSADGLMINAYVVLAEDAKANILLLHGMHGMDATSLFDYAKFLYDGGYSVIVADMRAHGKSGGESLSFGYLEPLDVLAVIDYIKQNDALKNDPIALYGLSMGGSVAINTAAQSEDVAAVIAISPFMSIQAQVRDYMHRDGAPQAFISSFMPSVNMVLRAKFGVSPRKESPLAQIAAVDAPLLIAHGKEDTQTGYYQSQQLFEAARSANKDLWLAEGADHLIVDDALAQESAFYRAKILGWLDALFE